MAFRSIGTLAGDVLAKVETLRAASDAQPAREFRGKDRTPKRPAKLREENNEDPTGWALHSIMQDLSPLARPVLRVLAGGRGMGTVHRRNGFPRPAVPRPMLSVVGGRDHHAASPTSAMDRARPGIRVMTPRSTS